MKMTKRLLSLVLAGVMLLSLAACGGKSDAPAATAPAATQAPAAPVSENAVYRSLYSSEVTTLNYLVTGNTNELSVAANVVDYR